MSKVSFHGRVIPETSDFTLHTPLSLKWQDNGAEYWMEFTLTIEHSKIRVDCLIENYDQAKHFDAIHMRASDIAEVATNTIAFAGGMGVTAVLDEFTDPTGQTGPFVLRDRQLSDLAGFARDGADFNEVLGLLLQEPTLYHALRDLIHAIRVSSQIPTSCGSAIEAVREVIVPNGLIRDQSWPVMRTALNVDRAYLQLVSDHYRGPRHGDHAHVPGSVTREIATRTWTVMNRFLIWLRRGRRPLPEAEFPLLKG